MVHTGGLLLREVPLNYGWNWLSFNLAFPDNSLDAALATLHHPDNDLIRSQGPFSLYSGSSWVGALTNLNNSTMYIYRADQPDTLRMLGTPIDPSTTPIPLVAGWNWIGYIPNYSLPIDDALASVAAQPGDIIKSQVAFAQYSEVVDGPNTYYRWIGNLKYMMPPNGYQIKLNSGGTLTYPPPSNPLMETPVQSRGENPQLAASNYWTVDPSQFEHSSTLNGMLRANGQNGTNSHMELGAFVGTQVRGSAKAIFIQPINMYLFFLTMYANQPGELMNFKLYSDSTLRVQNLVHTMYFSPNQHQGSIENPIPFDLPSSSTGEEFGASTAFDAQPNPFSNETTLRFNLSKSEEVTLTIADARGREILSRKVAVQRLP
ncbi:MAG: hypothetical protein ABMA02_13955 [Saprospiraceae bacterium]